MPNCLNCNLAWHQLNCISFYLFKKWNVNFRLKNVSCFYLQSICPDLHQGLGLYSRLFSQPSFPQSTLATFSYFDTMLLASGPLDKLFTLLETGSVNLRWSSTCQLLFIFPGLHWDDTASGLPLCPSQNAISPVVTPRTPYLNGWFLRFLPH